jgi:AraC-like DNA-binding protein
VGCSLPRGAGRRQSTVSPARRAGPPVAGRRHNLDLDNLARAVGVSAYHLSRTFRAVTGLTLSRYRIRLRLRRVLERLADGERDLAGLAAEAGFADQAHLTRTMHVEAGTTPAALRALLTTDGRRLSDPRRPA